MGLKKGTDRKGRRSSPGDKVLAAFTKGKKLTRVRNWTKDSW